KGTVPMVNRLLLALLFIIVAGWFAWSAPQMIRTGEARIMEGILLVIAAWVFVVYYMLYCVAYLVINRRFLMRRERSVIALGLVLTVVFTVAQGFVGPVLQVNFLGGTLGLMILYFSFYADAGPVWRVRGDDGNTDTAAMPVQADDASAQTREDTAFAPVHAAQTLADSASVQAQGDTDLSSAQTPSDSATPQNLTDPGDILPEPEAGISKEEAIRRVRAATPRMIATYRQMTEILEPYFGALQQEETDDTGLPGMEAEDLQELYEAVGEFAEIYDADGILRLLQQTDGYRVPEADRKKLEEIRKCVNNSDWAALQEVM
ncbi:MAG: hypothetical protein IJQ26_05590, partial [Lachnospiraceae bacterium]|nr:hypothetical protein [Lachnospiraceae bacterium]